MTGKTEIIGIAPTPLLRREGDALRQTVRVTIRHEGATRDAVVRMVAGDEVVDTPVSLTPGESVAEAELTEVSGACEVTGCLVSGGDVVASASVPWTPPRHWVIHVVQLSHHDVGYTDLASHVFPEQGRCLDAAIDMADATRDFPEDSRFRLVVEQTWSMLAFLRRASPERVAAMAELARRGDVEVTAMFGNMTTELCGHETLVRSVYHAFDLKREFGIPIVSAEHNDIPGFSWGLSQVLTEAGIRFFCPGIANYYGWGTSGSGSFWDGPAIFGEGNLPGAFWWEAQSGRRVLFWCNNAGCGGPSYTSMPGLEEKLTELEARGYPYTVLRWPVQGGLRDNSPYTVEYARTIRDWNDRWAYPRLVSSTNARFYEDFLPQVPDSLPVFRGEVPGQDYAVGASSTAVATAVNRRTHEGLPTAEALGTVAAAISDYRYQAQRIDEAYEEILWHDEHTWGHHFPCGPTSRTAELEKAVHAHRGAALAHDVLNKAMARIADAVRLDEEGIHLVVFNPTPRARSGMVTAPLREIDNCGSEMIATEDSDALSPALLQTRWHVTPPVEFSEGKFDLVDVESGKGIPFQVTELDSAMGPQEHAAQRMGVGAGGARYGMFEVPIGLRHDVVFLAEDVPALGYRTYRLQPREDAASFDTGGSVSGEAMENDFYRVELDPGTGCLRSLVDKETGREMVNAEWPHAFGGLLVRDPYGGEEVSACHRIEPGESGPFSSSVRAIHSVLGSPRVEVTYTLCHCEKRLDVAVHVLKDPTPLLETFVAFPFELPRGRFRYEGGLSIIDPTKDLLPGAYFDRLAVQNWVAVSDGEYSVLWTSHDAPSVSLGRLWEGRVSQAHSSVVRGDLDHVPAPFSDLGGGTIYSVVTANNFGTNFAVSQSGAMLFRYTMTTRAGRISDSEAAEQGRRFANPMSAILTKHPGERNLPPSGGFLAVDNPAVQVVAFKRAQEGKGIVLRLWNTAPESQVANISLPEVSLSDVVPVSVAEDEVVGESLECREHDFDVKIEPRRLVTFRLVTA